MANFAITVSAAQCRLLSFRPASTELNNVVRFEGNAQELKIPTIVCADILIDSIALDTLGTSLGAPRPNHPREIVLLCGAYLEEQISVAAQYLLGVGYPIILVRDLIVAKSSQHAHVHDLRLTQAGAIVTTSQQLMYEWAASEMDIANRAYLLEVLSQNAPR